MTSNQLCELSAKIIRELSPRGFEMVKHYIWLDDNQPHRPDYSNLMNALKSSATYSELNWVIEDIEIARLERSILEMVRAL